jgi:OCT family organic cation transporter-like MFS transporter 4/5
MVIPLFSYHWRVVMLFVTGVPLIGSSVFMTFIKESPRFLVIKKQFDRAKQVLKEIAQINGRPMPDEWVFEDEVRVNQLKMKMMNLIND